MNTVEAAFASGAFLGLSAGWSPGPLLTLVITETLRSGIGAGFRVAFAPLITDTPIILVALVLMPRLNTSLTVMGIITLAGAAVISWMAIESMTFKGTTGEAPPAPPASIDQNRSSPNGGSVHHPAKSNRADRERAHRNPLVSSSRWRWRQHGLRICHR